MNTLLYVGIDVSAQAAHVYLIDEAGQSAQTPLVVEQSPMGYQELEQALKATQIAPAAVLVVMEATGNYWMKLAAHLHQAGFAVSIVNPAQAHYFAKALLKRNKTDAVDAQVLALLAHKLQPPNWSPASETREQVYQRLVQRDAFQAMLQMERNRLHALHHRPVVVDEVVTRHQHHMAWLNQQITQIDRELKQLIAQDQAWNHSAQLLDSIPGFGPISIYWLLVATHNFTACETPEQLASYAGLVPRLFQSGSSVQAPPSIGKVCHSRLRQALYMASLSAVQHNRPIRHFYQRLVAGQKPKKVALCASARKLIHIAWAVVTKSRPFDPAFSQEGLPISP